MTRYETLGNSMRRHDHLKIACACGHRVEFSHGEAIGAFGEDAVPFDIRRRLRCSRCAKVGKVTVRF